MKLQDFICGLLAGCSKIIVGQPFDYIKTKVQVEALDTKRTLIQISKQIHKNHGILGFYRGASSLFFAIGLTNGLQFAVYEASKRLIYNIRTHKQKTKILYNNQSLKIVDVGLAGSFVGFCMSFIYSPVSYVKIQRQLNPTVKQGSFKILLTQLKTNQLKNIYKGLSATIFRDTYGCFFFYGVYEYCIRYLSQKQRHSPSNISCLLSGGIAGIIYCTISYPIDVVKTKVQNGETYNNAIQQFMKTKYRGFSPLLVGAILNNAVNFTAYQQTKLFFSSNRNSIQKMEHFNLDI